MEMKWDWLERLEIVEEKAGNGSEGMGLEGIIFSLVEQLNSASLP